MSIVRAEIWRANSKGVDPITHQDILVNPVLYDANASVALNNHGRASWNDPEVIAQGVTYYYQVRNISNTGLSISQNVVGIAGPPVFPHIFTFTPDHGETPVTIQFTAIAQAGATQYSWNFGDAAQSAIDGSSNTATGITASHTFRGGGPRDITLTVTLANGTSLVDFWHWAVLISRGTLPQESLADFDVYIEPPPNSGTVQGPAPLETIFSGLDSNSDFLWTFGDGTTQYLTMPGNPKITHVYQTPGSYGPSLEAFIRNDQGQIYTSQLVVKNQTYVVVT